MAVESPMQTSGEPKNITRVAPDESAEGKRWLDKRAKDLAIEVLEDLRRDKKKKPEDTVDSPLYERVNGVLEGNSCTYGAIKVRLGRYWEPSRHVGRVVKRVAACILEKPIEDITTDEEPERPDYVLHPPRIEASVPKTVTDHRAVIIGQLPRSGLFPAVLVQPQDGQRYWYPQIAGKHNPLRVDRAFGCLAHFGNPGSIRFPEDVALEFEVRVYALEREWPSDDADRLDENGLQNRLQDLGPVGVKEYIVRREIASLDKITLADGTGETQLLGPTKMIRCIPPITISWRGPQAHAEVRRGVDDHQEYCRETASSLRILLGDPTSPNRPGICVLGQIGKYRLRLYPEKFTFIDPPYEWWFDIRAHHGEHGKHAVKTGSGKTRSGGTPGRSSAARKR